MKDGCSHAICFYCENALSSRHEHDHFPVPKGCGGTATVAACINCHDLKDRVTLANWPVALAFAGVAEIVNAIPEDLRQGIDLDAPTGLVCALGDYTQHWQDWTVAGRLFYALSSRLAQMGERQGRMMSDQRPEGEA